MSVKYATMNIIPNILRLNRTHALKKVQKWATEYIETQPNPCSEKGPKVGTIPVPHFFVNGLVVSHQSQSPVPRVTIN
jgi:hypothetical protein